MDLDDACPLRQEALEFRRECADLLAGQHERAVFLLGHESGGSDLICEPQVGAGLDKHDSRVVDGVGKDASELAHDSSLKVQQGCPQDSYLPFAGTDFGG